MQLSPIICLFASLLLINPSFADAISAEAAMEDPSNPLILLSTSTGDIYIELLPNEAPDNVKNFLALAQGEIEFIDPNSNASFQPRYFDGMQFHRVVPDFVIQAGSPFFNPLGPPDVLISDEINADSLGLDRLPVMDEQGNFNPILNIGNQEEFHEVLLKPLFDRLNIETEAQMQDRQYEVLEILQGLTVKQAYENQGFRYSDNLPTRGISRGVVALANGGPNQNGPEFFIALQDSPWLNGKHTVIGRVVEGIETADAIGNNAVDPLNPTRFATLIYSLQRIN
ncbi:MAG: peptidylprolyl isomerase [Gammaproteobacteria bacterium]|nr:peptidylprolyl isomerase [Gammaproteobacteria bacterium]